MCKEPNSNSLLVNFYHWPVCFFNNLVVCSLCFTLVVKIKSGQEKFVSWIDHVELKPLYSIIMHWFLYNVLYKFVCLFIHVQDVRFEADLTSSPFPYPPPLPRFWIEYTSCGLQRKKICSTKFLPNICGSLGWGCSFLQPVSLNVIQFHHSIYKTRKKCRPVIWRK